MDDDEGKLFIKVYSENHFCTLQYIKSKFGYKRTEYFNKLENKIKTFENSGLIIIYLSKEF